MLSGLRDSSTDPTSRAVTAFSAVTGKYSKYNIRS